jgi:predicted PurR-regulated permease PerM
MARPDRSDTRVFLQRTALTIGLLLLAAAATALLVRFPEIPLLIFGATVGAVLLDGLARPLVNRTHLPRSWAVGVVSAALLAALSIGIWTLGPGLVDQMARLVDGARGPAEDLVEDLAASGWLSSGDEPAGEQHRQALIATLEPIASSARSMGAALTSAASGIAIVSVLAFFLAMQADLYTHGCSLLVPKQHRARLGEVADAALRALRWWLVGRVAAMTAVGLLSFVGLLALEIPLAGALALLAGLLSFVPYLGPVLSGVPAVLVGFGHGGFEAAAWVAGLYLAVQAIENNFITPFIQFRAVSLPPAVLIGSQLAMGILFGLLGLLLAAPIAVVAVVLVQMLYVQDVVGVRVEVLAERNGRRGRGRKPEGGGAAVPPAAAGQE